MAKDQFALWQVIEDLEYQPECHIIGETICRHSQMFANKPPSNNFPNPTPRPAANQSRFAPGLGWAAIALGLLAGAPVAAQPTNTEKLRQELLIPPVRIGPQYSAPSLQPGVPSAFIANWGDYFISVSGATEGRQRDNVDGSVNLGVGIGDAVKAVALELDLNIASINNFGANGTFDAKLARVLVNRSDFRLGASVGVVNIAEWGDDPKADTNPYGVATVAWPLQPNNINFKQTLQISVGAGGETFAYKDDPMGAFGSIGVELLPNLGISAGWSGRGANAGLSLVPFKRTPLTLSLVAADIFNTTSNGPVGVLSISWGSNFRTAQF